MGEINLCYHRIQDLDKDKRYKILENNFCYLGEPALVYDFELGDWTLESNFWIGVRVTVDIKLFFDSSLYYDYIKRTNTICCLIKEEKILH